MTADNQGAWIRCRGCYYPAGSPRGLSGTRESRAWMRARSRGSCGGLRSNALLARRAPSKSLNAISPTRTTIPPATHAKVTMVASLTPNGRVAWSIWRRHGRYVELAWRQGHIWLVLLEHQTRHRNADGRVSVARGRSSNLDVALTAVSAGRD